jgi:hypothetical protein
MFGKLIIEENLHGKETKISTQKIKSGTYIVTIQPETGDKLSQKIIVY